MLTGEDAYTEKELKEYGLPERFTQEELMDIAKELGIQRPERVTAWA